MYFNHLWNCQSNIHSYKLEDEFESINIFASINKSIKQVMKETILHLCIKTKPFGGYKKKNELTNN